MVSFGHTINQVRIPKSLMDAPLKNPDQLISKMAQKHCDDQLMNVEPMQQGIVARVKKCLEAEKGVYPNLEQVSNQLNMSSRSLKRKLKAANSSFQLILDNLRKTEAIEYLCHSDQTIDEISRLLDFSDPSNFGRAFKKWTGVSPRDYRSRALENLAQSPPKKD
jgi:AraC-like DNA-binding protein